MILFAATIKRIRRKRRDYWLVTSELGKKQFTSLVGAMAYLVELLEHLAGIHSF